MFLLANAATFSLRGRHLSWVALTGLICIMNQIIYNSFEKGKKVRLKIADSNRYGMEPY